MPGARAFLDQLHAAAVPADQVMRAYPARRIAEYAEGARDRVAPRMVDDDEVGPALVEVGRRQPLALAHPHRLG